VVLLMRTPLGIRPFNADATAALSRGSLTYIQGAVGRPQETVLVLLLALELHMMICPGGGGRGWQSEGFLGSWEGLRRSDRIRE